MFIRIATAMFALAIYCLPGSVFAQTFFTATFSAAQQTADVASEATGTAAMMLTDEGLRFIVSVEGLSGDIANAHFHNGPAGENGGVVRTILDEFTGGTAIGTWSGSDEEPLTDELIAALMAGQLYLNIHTGDNPGGEIRAQIYPTSGAGLTANLTAAQSTSDITSDAHGTAAVQVTDAGVLYFVTVEGLSGDITNAHFHSGAAGTNGGPVRTIAGEFVGNSAFGLWTAGDDEPLTSEHVAALMTGQIYLNIHTAANPGGEIRGQVIATSGWGFSAALDADQQTGEVTSDAMGTAGLTLTDAGLVYRITVEGLSGDIAAAHFHNAPAGANGGVVRTIEFSGDTAAGLWSDSDDEPLTGELIRELIAGNIYINVHTADNAAGEIRGQVLLNAGTSLTAALTPQQQTADVTSDASGTAALTLTPDGVAFNITVDGLSGDIANAHFHNAPMGENGGVVRTIAGDFTGNTASGLWTSADDEALTPELMAELLTGNLYINIHTADNPAGELRGQVLVSGGASLIAHLTNEQQNSEVTQEASGTAVMTLTPKGLVYSLSVEGLSGDVANAHFHGGPAGVNGGVLRGVFDDFTGGTATGLWSADDDQALTDSLRNLLISGGVYLNIHTAANPGGEIRGQVRLAGGIGSAVHMSAGQQINDTASDAQGAAALTLTSEGLVFDLTAEGLSGDITNAHFHNGPLGANGGVVRTIAGDIDGNTGFGVWRASDDESLTAELTNELLAGNIYINVHTADFAPGEIRGQVNPGSIVVTSIENVGTETPETFALSQNYPNPFNPTTTIEFSLTSSTKASLAVYNVLGQKVATLVNETLPAGTSQVTFEARDLASGLYYYRLDAGDLSLTRSMMLLK